jgi:hypothetical protein
LIKPISLPILCALLIAPVLAQTEQYDGYSITFTKDRPSGKAVFESRPFDEIWTATIKALKLDKYKIEASERESGRISAILLPAWGQTYDLLGGEPHWEIFVKATEGNAQLTFVAENIEAPTKAIRSLCKKIAKRLDKTK